MNFFNLSFLLKNIPINQALIEYKIRQSLNEDELKSTLENKKWAIFNYHKNNNPFYANFLQGAKPINWFEIPIISKNNFQVQGLDFINPLLQKKDLIMGKTSGSSGVPLRFARDKFSHALLWANILFEYRKMGIEYGKSKQARFYGIPLEGVNYYKEHLKDKILNRDRFVVHDLSDSVLEKFLDKFKKNRYDYIYGYTNSIVIFAKFLQRKGLKLKEICPSLLLCVVTSEVCTDSDKMLLFDVLGVKVYNEYGSSEAAIIALDNPEGQWILNDILLHIEFVDDNGMEVKIGERGRIVVTSLDNKAMPLIRYEVGDVGVLSEIRNGKRRVLKQLDGRLNDNLKLPGGKLVPGFTLYYATKALMDSLPGLMEYNIQQIAINHINFDLVISSDIELNERKLKEDLNDVVYKYLQTKIKITYKFVSKIDRSKSGKAKHFISLI